jgi:hypothetical protein
MFSVIVDFEECGCGPIAVEAHVTEEEDGLRFRFLAFVDEVFFVVFFFEDSSSSLETTCDCLEFDFFVFTRVDSRFQSSGIRGSPSWSSMFMFFNVPLSSMCYHIP